MRSTVYLALISVALISLAFALTPRTRPVQQRLISHDASFAQRYGEHAAPVRMVQIVKVKPEVEIADDDVNVISEAPALPPTRRIRVKPPAGGDVFKRHGLRKVMTGRYRWKCRK